MALADIEGGRSKDHVARTYGVSGKIVARWLERFKAEGRAGMADRSSRPRYSPSATDQAVADPIVALRRQRWTGQHIALEAGVSPATVSRVLKRAGLSRLKDLELAEPVKRYERDHPGEMIHIDIKKLGRFDRIGHRTTGDRAGQSNSRGVGWEFVHVAIDEASRIAFSQVFGRRKEGKRSRLPQGGGGLLCRPRRHRHPRHDRQRLMLPLESLRKSLPQARAQACQDKALYPPGKAERFIQTALRNGPTPWPIRTPTIAPPNCRSGSIATIGIGPTAA